MATMLLYKHYIAEHGDLCPCCLVKKARSLDDLLLLIWTQLGPMNEVSDGLWSVCAGTVGVGQTRTWLESVHSGCDKVQQDLESVDAKLQRVLNTWSAETVDAVQWNLVCVMKILTASLEKTDDLCEDLIRISQDIAKRDSACIPQLRELMLTLQYQGAHDTLYDKSVRLRVPGDAPERPLPMPRRDWTAVSDFRPQPKEQDPISQSSSAPVQSSRLANQPGTRVRCPRQTTGRLPRPSIALQKRKLSGAAGGSPKNIGQLPCTSVAIGRRPSIGLERKPSFANCPPRATLLSRPEVGTQRTAPDASSTSRVPALASRIPSSRIPSSRIPARPAVRGDAAPEPADKPSSRTWRERR